MNEGIAMVARKSFLGGPPNDEVLDKLLEEAKDGIITEQMLAIQRISFAYGNAPKGSNVTKDTLRELSKSIRLKHVG